MSDRKALALYHNKSLASSFSSFKNKRKNANFSKEAHSKKPKGAKGPLTSDKLARARKENLCFNCLGQHARKDCSQLCSNDPVTNKGKEKAVHTVQLFPLETSTKYSVVQVSHQTEVHECCLTATPWQPTFGPHELFQLHGTINRLRVHVLINDGSTHNFLNYTLVKKLRLPQVPSSHTYVVSIMNGSD